MLICLAVIVCVAGILIAPNVDLPYTNLKSFRVAHALAACLTVGWLLWLLAGFAIELARFPRNSSSDSEVIQTIPSICVLLC